MRDRIAAFSPNSWNGTSYVKGATIGMVGAIVVCLCLIVAQLPTAYGIGFFGAFLALTAASYFGLALTDGRTAVFLQETCVGLVVFAAALAGLWHSPAWLAAGCLAHAHGAWDVLHHPHGIGAPVSMT